MPRLQFVRWSIYWKRAKHKKLQACPARVANTPRYDGLSPAQWLTGHRQRTDLVAAPEAYMRVSDSKFKEHEAWRGHWLRQEKKRVDQSSHTLEPFQPGEGVLVQDPKTSRWSIEATIISRWNKRSYIVEVDDLEFIKNRRLIRPVAIIFMSEPKEQSQRDGSQRDGSQRERSHRDCSQRDGSQRDCSQIDHFQRDFCQTNTEVPTRNLQQTKARSQRRVTFKS